MQRLRIIGHDASVLDLQALEGILGVKLTLSRPTLPTGRCFIKKDVKMPKLTYVSDPLCGWCYGFVPTLDAFAKAHPEVEIEVVPGGLVTGDRVGPYSEMFDYISGAAPRMTSITGQALGQQFFDLIGGEDSPLSASAPPSHAILQMKEKASSRDVLRFAHALLQEHFQNGFDLNAPATYDMVCDKLQLPRLDTAAISTSTDQDAPVAKSFQNARSLGVSSFPTVLIQDDEGNVIGQIDTVYESEEFAKRFEDIVS